MASDRELLEGILVNATNDAMHDHKELNLTECSLAAMQAARRDERERCAKAADQCDGYCAAAIRALEA